MPLQSSSVSIDAMSNQTKIWAFILGPILAVVVYYLMPDQFVNTSGQVVPFTHAGKACAAVTTLMAVWWFTEAIPIAVTAMIPIVLYPLLEVATPVNTMRHYASGTIFLFLGGFLIAAAIHRWHLDRRIALATISIFGTKPKQIIFGLMISTAFRMGFQFGYRSDDGANRHRGNGCHSFNTRKSGNHAGRKKLWCSRPPLYCLRGLHRWYGHAGRIAPQRYLRALCCRPLPYGSVIP